MRVLDQASVRRRFYSGCAQFILVALALCGEQAMAQNPRSASSSQVPHSSSNASTPELGALRNITQSTVVEALRLAKTGKVYSLAIPVEPIHGANRGSYQVKITTFAGGTLTGFDDQITLSPSLGTSIDGLGHIGKNGVHYNGVRQEDIAGPQGIRVYGIQDLPPIVTRGVLLDLARHLGVPVAPGGTAVNKAMIEAMAKAQGVRLGRGDVVLLHTGWQDASDALKKGAGNPGFGLEGAGYLASLGVVAVGGDAGAEVNPPEQNGNTAAVHQLLIAGNGVYILEGVRTKDLARDRVYEFLFVAAAPRLVGSVQANLHPIAIK